MIPILLRQLRWRIAALALACFLFYLGDPALHEHPAESPGDVAELLEPFGISFTIANVATAGMVVLLAGFIATDRRRGYYRLAFSHPTRPLAFYGLRWVLSLALALLAGAFFWLFAQLAAWGGIRVGPSFLLQALLLAVVYGGLTAFFSALVPRGDGLLAVILFFLTDLWLSLVQASPVLPFTPGVRAAISFVLPPHSAVSDVYNALLSGGVAWGAAAYALGYGLFWLILAGLLVKYREWP
ncbi:MAG TPA: hypothetical protein VK358_16910 [Longimicrobium sp.]|nr:hypothetical protein [Longimicrobium sp.]